MGVAMDLPTTVAGSAVLDSVGIAGLATASEVAGRFRIQTVWDSIASDLRRTILNARGLERRYGTG